MEILFLSMDRTDGSSFYRSAGVTSSLRKVSGENITVAQWSELELDWSLITQFDIIMFQRPYTRQALDLCRYIKHCNVGLWLDYDDNLFAIPPENRAMLNYTDEIQGYIKEMIQTADVVTVSTEDLRLTLLPFNQNTKVIPNAFNDLMFKREKPRERQKLITWRGSDTHIYDIMHLGSGMNRAIMSFHDWQFLFFGYYPWFLCESQNKSFLKNMDLVLFFNNLMKMAPAVVHVPLHDNLFNHCKSNIAAIEGAFSGAVCVVPEWWDIPGTLKYNDNDSYFEAISAVLSGKVNIEANNRLSWEYIMDTLTLSKVNLLRWDVIKSFK